MYCFDKSADRRGTDCTKWDRYKTRYHLNDVIPLWVADMDFDCGDFIIQAIEKRAEHPIFGYTDPSDRVRDAVIRWNRDHYGCEVLTEQIGFSTGVVYSISVAVEYFTEKTEKVLVQPPVYPPFFNVPKALGRSVVENPLVQDSDGNWRFDYDGLKKLLSSDPSIRLFVLCNPHNPVGRCWTKGELSRLMEICAEYHLLVLSDEIHADIALSGHRHCSLLSLDPALTKNVIVCGSPTKSFNLAGLKISYVIIPDAERKKKFDFMMKMTGTSSINIFGFEVLQAAYLHGDQWLKECVDYIEGNMDFIDRFLCDEMPEVLFRKPESTYLAWLDFRNAHVGEDFNDKLKFHGGVELNDGASFSTGGAGYQRINAACPRSMLKEGLQRVEKFIHQ